jgi:hypothetical protein
MESSKKEETVKKRAAVEAEADIEISTNNTNKELVTKQSSKNTAGSVVKKEAAPQISNWLIAIGVGVTITAATVTAIYVVKTQRAKELNRLRYGYPQEENVNTYSNRISKYWNFTVKTFTAVKTIVVDFLKPKEINTPCGTQDTANPMTAYSDDSIESGDDV